MTPTPAPREDAALAALRELSDAATPGPWTQDGIDVYEDGGEIQINVGSPSGLIATFPTGVFALSEVQWATADDPEAERDARWNEAKTKQATPDATFAVAAVNYVRTALRASNHRPDSALLNEAIEWIADGATDSEGMDPYGYDLVQRLRAAADNPVPDARDRLLTAIEHIEAQRAVVNTEPWDARYRTGYNVATDAALAHINVSAALSATTETIP